MTRALFIVAPEGFRDEELFHPKEILDSKGIETVIASTKKGICNGTLGGTAESSLTLSEVNVDGFDGLVFVGGTGIQVIRNSEESMRISKEAVEKGKLLCAICWSSTILAKAGVLNGKKATVWLGLDDDYQINTDKVLEKFGAVYIDEGVVMDGKIITADGPSSAKDFGEAIAKSLKSED